MLNPLIRHFVKDYENTGNPEVRRAYGKFASVVGVITNLVLFVIKVIAGLISKSVSITADAVNNLSDSGSSLVTLFGFKISGKPADEKHPYGHARMEYISGLIVAIIIMFLGLQLVSSSIAKIIRPENMEFSPLAAAILAVSILLKLWFSLFSRRIGKLVDSSTLIATSVDSRNDILATSAVLISIIINRITGYNLDGYIGTAVSLFIIISGVKIATETISTLLGSAPSRELVEKCYRKLLSYEGIVGIHDLNIHTYGEGNCFASVHCEVDYDQDIMVSHDIIDNIERDFLEEEGIHLVIHLDPVVLDDERTNALKDKVNALISEISPEISMHDFRVVWGLTHSNLIFDIVIPFGMQDNEIVEKIKKRIEELDPSYRSFITVDHTYVPDIDDIYKNT
ncbi:MAG: cation transporter [Clostridiales bacterium]|nr:cation transporter [Clostridiales bacterium]